MNPKKYLLNRIRGWLPKKPSLLGHQKTKIAKISQQPDRERKIFRISSVANVIMVGTFLGLHLLIDPNNKNVEYIVISWIIFILALISVNFLLYRYSKKKTTNQIEESKS